MGHLVRARFGGRSGPSVLDSVSRDESWNLFVFRLTRLSRFAGHGVCCSLRECYAVLVSCVRPWGFGGRSEPPNERNATGKSGAKPWAVLLLKGVHGRSSPGLTERQGPHALTSARPIEANLHVGNPVQSRAWSHRAPRRQDTHPPTADGNNPPNEAKRHWGFVVLRTHNTLQKNVLSLAGRKVGPKL